MKQRILSFLIILCLLIGVMPQLVPHAFAATYSGTCGANLTWTLDTDTGVLRISGTGDMLGWGFNFPAPWHDYRHNIKSIEILSGVTSIGGCAFNQCESLTSITIPNSVTSIGSNAFFRCTGLTSVTIPNSVITIEHNAFDNCIGLTSMIIPGSVTTVYDHAFNFCTNLTSVTILDGVATIGDSAFRDCAGLSSVTIPDSVTSIGGEAFFNTAYYNEGANWEQGVLYIGKHLIDAKTEVAGSYSVREGTVAIADSAFRNCSGLSSVTIPDSVTSIGDYAFSDCPDLISVTIGDGVTSIGSYVFHYTSYYEEETNWEQGVLYIGNHLIDADMDATSSYSIRKGTITIADNAFNYCGGLTSVTIPDSVRSIGRGAFYCCIDLTSVIIGHGVTSIGDNAFCLCPVLSSVTIGDSVTTIGNRAFENCERLKSVTIPDSVTSIGDSAFAWCTGMESVTIPDSVTSIGAQAFYYCTGLTSVTIGDSVTYIGDSAFAWCDTLEKVYILNPSCKIYNNPQTITLSKDGAIYGYAGSTAEAYAHKYGYPFYPLADEPELDESIVIYHSLNLASDIAINYAVKETALAEYDSYYMECVLPVYEGNTLVGTEVLTLQPELRSGYCYFVLDGLTALEMNNMVEATLHMEKNGKHYISNADSYSIATYAYAQLNSTTETLKALSANLLRYGAKAQLWKGYRTDALADAAMTDAHKAYLKDLDSVEFGNNNEILTDIANPVITWAGKTMSLESKVSVRFVMNTTNYTGDLSNLSLRISFVNIDGETETVTLTECNAYNVERNYYAFDFDGLLSAEMRSVMQATVYEGDTQFSPTMVYSIDTYGTSTTGSLRTLVQGMLAYGDSAKAFFAK